VSLVRVVALFVLLPLVLAFDRAGYYTMRSALVVAVLEGGGTHVELARLFGIAQFVNLAGVVVGGLVGIVLRPIWLVVGGAVIALIGYATLALVGATGGTLYAGIVLVTGGLALVKPALFALAAIEIGHPREQLRSALFVLLYAMVNAGALFASAASPLILAAGVRAPFALGAGLELCAAVLGFVLLAVLLATRKEEPTPAPDAPQPGRVALGAGLLALALVPYLIETTATHQALPDWLRRAGVPASNIGMLMGLNPSVVLLSSSVLFVVSLILHFVGKQLSSLYVAAAGLCFTGLASTPFVLLGSTSSASSLVPLAMVGAAGIAIAETLVAPYALSRMLGDVGPRFAPAVAAGWFVVSALVSAAVSPLAVAFPSFVPVLVAGCALFCLALGVGGFFAIRPLYRGIFGPTPTAAQPE
jgi:dipeptide/tripeptide permease